MRITGKIRLVLYKSSTYNPQMGHSSRLLLDGEDILADDGNGGLAITASAMSIASGEILVSNTRGSSTVVQISTVEKGDRDTLVISGQAGADGVAASIIGGIACHASWAWSVETVQGKFGVFTGADAVGRYETAKAVHREKFFSRSAEGHGSWCDLTPRGAAALEALDGTHTNRDYSVTVDGRMVPLTQFADMADTWIAERRAEQARLERINRANRLGAKIPPTYHGDVQIIKTAGRRTRWLLVAA